MSAHVLLNLSNEYRKKDQVQNFNEDMPGISDHFPY